MTITEVMNAIHAKYEHNVDYFESYNEDYKTRLAFINEKINLWENEDGVLWRELYTTVSASFDDDGRYELSDMIMPASRILSNGDYFEFLSPELIQEQEKHALGKKVYTVTAEDGLKYLNVLSSMANEQFEFKYYRKANIYTTGTETTPIEMTDPYFLVHAVVAELFLDDGDSDKASVATQIATQKLNSMITKNNAVPVFADTKQEDYNFKGFGN